MISVGKMKRMVMSSNTPVPRNDFRSGNQAVEEEASFNYLRRW